MSRLLQYINLRAIREKSGYDQLDSRQRILLFGAVVILLLFGVFQLIVSPYYDARARLLSSVQKRQEELQQIQKLRQDYLLIKKEEGGVKDRLAKRAKNFALFSFVDQQAEQAKIKGKIIYMKPSLLEGDGVLRESLVELKLQETTLEELVGFLKFIESRDNVVTLRRISIQESGKEQGYLDVIMQIVTFVEATGS
jgi:general secretion pathway protein M